MIKFEPSSDVFKPQWKPHEWEIWFSSHEHYSFQMFPLSDGGMLAVKMKDLIGGLHHD